MAASSRLDEKAKVMKAKEFVDHATATGGGAPATAADLDHPSFVTAELHTELCDILASLAPLEVQYRGHPVTSRPKCYCTTPSATLSLRCSRFR